MRTATEEKGEGISYRRRMPLKWVPLDALPEGVEAERLAETNARLLSVIALLEEHGKSSDEPSATELELQRVHQKLNLLLELFGSFLSLQTPRPEPIPVRLSWRGVAWEGPPPQPAPGAVGLVEIFLSKVLPQPLLWPARIVQGAEGETYAEFEAVPEYCQAALERHVFQHHRREVAEARQPSRHTS